MSSELKLRSEVVKSAEITEADTVSESAFSALLCFFGCHSWGFQFDKGRRDCIVQKTEFGILFYSDVKVYCDKCGKIRDAKYSSDYELPEIL